jgi:hypothetical protein
MRSSAIGRRFALPTYNASSCRATIFTGRLGMDAMFRLISTKLERKTTAELAFANFDTQHYQHLT